MDFYLLLLIIFIPVLAQLYVKSCYSKYSGIKNESSITGVEAARKILDNNGLQDITIKKINGTLTDFYNPLDKSISLSSDIYSDKSVASIAIAAHEVGHAIQDKEKYSFMVIRSKIVPVVNFSSKISTIFIVLGLILEIVDLYYIGIILLLVGLVFQLITLPVEFNASKRAKEELKKYHIITDKDSNGVTKTLKAAAYTYVAGFLATAAQIIRLIGINNRN